MKVIIYNGHFGRCMIYGDVDVGTLPMPGDAVIIKNARMLLRVATVGNLGIAAVGPKPGSDTRITHPVLETSCIVHSAALVSPDAADAIEAWPGWD